MKLVITGCERPQRALAILASLRGYDISPREIGQLDDGHVTVAWHQRRSGGATTFWLRVVEYLPKRRLSPLLELTFFQDGTVRAEAWACGAGLPAEFARRLFCNDVGRLLPGFVLERVEAPFSFLGGENEGWTG